MITIFRHVFKKKSITSNYTYESRQVFKEENKTGKRLLDRRIVASLINLIMLYNSDINAILDDHLDRKVCL